jgi:hypothetical protein
MSAKKGVGGRSPAVGSSSAGSPGPASATKTPGKAGAGSTSAKYDIVKPLEVEFIFSDLLEAVTDDRFPTPLQTYAMLSPLQLTALGLVPDDTILIYRTSGAAPLAMTDASAKTPTAASRLRSPLAPTAPKTPATPLLKQALSPPDPVSALTASVSRCTIEDRIKAVWMGKVWPAKKQDAHRILVNTVAHAAVSLGDSSLSAASSELSTCIYRLPGGGTVGESGPCKLLPAAKVLLQIDATTLGEEPGTLKRIALMVERMYRLMGRNTGLDGLSEKSLTSIQNASLVLTTVLAAFMNSSKPKWIQGICLMPGEPQVMHVGMLPVVLSLPQDLQDAAYSVCHTTQFAAADTPKDSKKDLDKEDITASFGGYEEILKDLEGLISTALFTPHIYTDFNISPPR